MGGPVSPDRQIPKPPSVDRQPTGPPGPKGPPEAGLARVAAGRKEDPDQTLREIAGGNLPPDAKEGPAASKEKPRLAAVESDTRLVPKVVELEEKWKGVDGVIQQRIQDAVSKRDPNDPNTEGEYAKAYQEAMRFREERLDNFLQEQGVSPEDAAKYLKSVSSLASGTVEGYSNQLVEKYTQQTAPDEPDIKKYGRTYNNNGSVTCWIDERGRRYIVQGTPVVDQLVIQNGLTKKENQVPHSNDGGEWMLYHNPFFQQMRLLDNQEQVRLFYDQPGTISVDELNRLQQEIYDIKVGKYSPDSYKDLLIQRKDENAQRVVPPTVVSIT